jgi:hypothetical protein
MRAYGRRLALELEGNWMIGGGDHAGPLSHGYLLDEVEGALIVFFSECGFAFTRAPGMRFFTSTGIVGLTGVTSSSGLSRL